MTKYLRLYLAIILLFFSSACQMTGTPPTNKVQTQVFPTQDIKKLSTFQSETGPSQPKQIISTEKPFINSKITPENATFVKQIGSLGIGTNYFVHWSPAGDQLAVPSMSGICLFNVEDLKLERCFGEREYADISLRTIDFYKSKTKKLTTQRVS